jgi:hypothetical protein
MKKPPVEPHHLMQQQAALEQQQLWYKDAETGFIVLTDVYLKKRGTCCGSRCRHCPYDWKNVQAMLVAVLFFCCVLNASAQVSIDTVLSFVPGRGQNIGQSPAFFPQNIFRGPDAKSNDTVPSVDPREVCSLGFGGSIVVGSQRAVCVDRPGIDVTIYENVFRVQGQSKIYAEPATVELSTDGLTWVEVPCSFDTFEGCAGTVVGGSGIDLANVGIDSVRWIRITDVTEQLLGRRNHPLYDPTLSGFDLDAVVYHHYVPKPLTNHVVVDVTSRWVRVRCTTSGTVRFYTPHGALVSEERVSAGESDIYPSLVPGCYLGVVECGPFVESFFVLQ